MTEEKNEVVSSSVVDDPFSGMKIRDWGLLDQIEGRSVCSRCNKSRKYFCYTCYIPMSSVEDIVPRVKLPVKIDIIKHAHEIDGKSTAAHAAVIAPDDVRVYTYPSIPDYSSEENVVLIFPGKNALSIREYIENDKKKMLMADEDKEECTEPKNKRAHFSPRIPISKAVFIDSTWNQSRGIYKDQRFKEMPCVVFQSRISQFWRHQHGSPRWFLATIEAIHQFLAELHVHCNLGNYQLDPNEKDACTMTSAASEECKTTIETSDIDRTLSHTSKKYADTEDQRAVDRISLKGDKPPSKFVKNLALCRGIRVDTGDNPGVKLFGPEQWKGKYYGEYDDLLFFFRFMFYKIHSIYDHSKLYSYQRSLE